MFAIEINIGPARWRRLTKTFKHRESAERYAAQYLRLQTWRIVPL